MAELADVPVLKTGGRKTVRVRFPVPALWRRGETANAPVLETGGQ